MNALVSRSRSMSASAMIITDAISSLGKFLAVQRCAFADTDLESDMVTVLPDYCASGIKSIAGVRTYSSYGTFLMSEYQAGRTVVVDDICNDPEKVPTKTIEAYEALGITAHLTVPPVHSSRPVSTLEFIAAFCGYGHLKKSSWSRVLQCTRG